MYFAGLELQSLVSDNGPPFSSAVFHEFFRMQGSTVRHSSPHTPQSHGGIEQQNGIYNDIVQVLNFTRSISHNFRRLQRVGVNTSK